MIRWLAPLALVLMIGHAHGQTGGCPLGSTCEPYQGQIPYPAVGGTAKRTPSARADDHGLNILECGADPTGNTDSTAAIQECIDKVALQSFGNHPRSIYCPGGQFLTSQPIFLDPPGNLRGADGVNGEAYDPAQTFAQGETANYNGVPYVSLINNNTGNTPSSSPSDWQPFNWNSGTTYAAGAIVRYNGIPWVSLINSNTGNIPHLDYSATPGHWVPTTIVPSNSGFALTLFGEPGTPNAGTQYGCTITPDNRSVGVWVGPGQGMTLRDFSLSATQGAFNQSLLPPNGIGVAIAGGSGGANNTLVQSVEVDDFYTSFSVAPNIDQGGGALGAQNSFQNIQTSGCTNGIVLNSAQNDINNVRNVQMGCTFELVSEVGPGFSVRDSNLSDTGGDSNTFTISSVSSVTYNSSPGTYTFTATIASPDDDMTLCYDSTGYITGGSTSVGNCTYNSWMIITKGFGIVPMQLTSWNASTNVGTFTILAGWAKYYFPYASGGDNATTRSDISSEISAATSIFASQMAVVLFGNAYDVSEIHIENNGQCTQMIHDTSGFTGDRGVNLRSIRFNGTQLGGSGSMTDPHFLCQQSFPFVWMDAGAANIDWGPSMMNQTVGNDSEPIVMDLDANATLNMHTNAASGGVPTPFTADLVNPNVRSPSQDNNGTHGAQNGGNYSSLYSQGQGGGYWNPCPFMFLNSNGGQGGAQMRGGIYAATPCLGFRPDPGYRPRLGSGQYTTIAGVNGSTSLATYMPIDGSTIYSVADFNDQQGFEFQSTHQYFSWGQNLTTSNISGLSLSWVGGGFAVAADSGTLGYVFPGLGIKLNNGAGDVEYEVTGVYASVSLDGGTHPGYFTVLNAAQIGAPFGLTGTSGTAYSATQIDEDPFAIGLVGVFGSTAAPVLSSCGGGSPTPTAGSNSRSGSFTTGSGSPTACTVTFASAYPNQAFCSISPANSAANGISGGTYISAQSKSAFTVTLGTGTSSAEYNYTCYGS